MFAKRRMMVFFLVVTLGLLLPLSMAAEARAAHYYGGGWHGGGYYGGWHGYYGGWRGGYYGWYGFGPWWDGGVILTLIPITATPMPSSYAYSVLRLPVCWCPASGPESSRSNPTGTIVRIRKVITHTPRTVRVGGRR